MVWGENLSPHAHSKRTMRLVCLLGSVACACLVLCSPAAFAGSLDDVSWTVSSSQTGATNVTYAFAFTTASTATITKVTMTVPGGTGGTPSIGTVYGLGAGEAASVGDELSYTLTTAVTVPAGTRVAVSFAGLTNTRTASSYVATVTTYDGVDAVAMQASPAVAFGCASTRVTVTVAETLTVTGGQTSGATQDPAAGPTVQSNADSRHTVAICRAGQQGFVTYVVTPGY
jgi:hypothetical protein